MTKTIYSEWLASALMKKGFRIKDIRLNPKDNRFKCYDFEDSVEFENAISEIMSKR